MRKIKKRQIKTLTDAAIAFLAAIEKAGYTAMLYTGKYFLENDLDESRLKNYAFGLPDTTGRWDAARTFGSILIQVR
ncbi:hypothetical protein KEH51_26270 [[Brevibacterium] frigoritolerans]|uniref:Uncharacterized protein n=1 Tax=Peribacillus frigoritolerans TaxID=450367 RepID=A0A941J7X4_9BACI|nr:hypothetical protein [Peribacillus frigoritolerans]